MTTRLPPQNLDAERGVLGSIMLLNEAIDDILLRPEDFYVTNHGDLYAAIRKIYHSGQPADLVTIAETLQAQGKLDRMGGAVFLAEILESVPHAAHVKYYANIVREKAIQRAVIGMCSQAIDRAYSETTADELLTSVMDDLIELQTLGTTSGEVSLADSIDETLRGMDEARNGEEDEQESNRLHVDTGLREVDEMLGRLRPSQLVILAARPGVGKSALAMQVAKHVAKAGGGILCVSMEMSHVEQTERLLGSESSVSARDITDGKVTDDQRLSVIDSAGELRGLNWHYLDATFDADAIMNSTRAIHAKHGLDLLVVDYLQLCESSGVKEEFRTAAVTKISRQFKKLAQQLKIPVLALSQLNRDVEKRNDKRPKLSDLRESGAIEQDANVVMFLHRPDMYNAELSPGEAEVIVQKNRSGGTGIAKVKFEKVFTRFSDLEFYDGNM